MRWNQSLDDISTLVKIILTQTCNKQPPDLNMVIVNTLFKCLWELLAFVFLRVDSFINAFLSHLAGSSNTDGIML